MSRQISSLLIKTKAVTVSAGKPFVWASGILSPIYTDNRIVLAYPAERRAIVDAFVEEITHECPDFDVVAGVATSAIPWATLVADDMHKPLIYVRGKKKEHGTESLVEGRLEKGQKVVLIEDLVSTGGSSVAAVNAIRDAGGSVTHCFAIFTYGLQRSVQNFAAALCRLVTLTDFETLAQIGRETGYITHEDEQELARWAENPARWKPD
jgi:orotate phosphoribosyltransferase